ncbi:GNAT family N-acetyltransferase [Sphingobacterium puteale]|uniref:GNAT family N-acetyltransferase n=2 Tax=Sphingobacterium TaxID=28453 RepID=A0A363NYC0_9SPHI|nr:MULTISPECIES: GNAT family N-acetyltransferase [Sphingobacterium]PUV25816.1 GNAT family N-acetyltransferase [Sphingobacterium athyrii]QIH33308.1 GNAT family N-acetyltransferase [Sphingobacterium sp. DR205]RKO72728.1 GNAT family N-acetyltransferase [Sphingobacterium puteale]
MNYQIKKASLEDLEQTAELFNLYRIFYRQESDLEKGKVFLKERFLNSESDIFLAMVDGKAVGFVQLYKLFHYTKLEMQWLLSDLFVHQDYRGKGLSVALIDRSKQWCTETGACGLMLETEKTNDIGNTLYPRCGFEYDGAHNYYHWWSKK